MEFQKFILNVDKVVTTESLEGSKILIMTDVIADPNDFKLSITASDISSNLWRIQMNRNDFEIHQISLGLNSPNWAAYFELLSKAFSLKTFSLSKENHHLVLNLSYPLSEANLKGKIRLDFVESTTEQRTEHSFRALDYLLRTKNLKREDEDIPAPVKVAKAFTQPKLASKTKKKKPLQIGSRLKK